LSGRELWSLSLISGPTFSITALNPQQAEGGAEEVTIFSFEVTLSKALEEASRVSWALQLSGGSGGADSGDFSPGQATSGVLTFNPGELSKTISIGVSGDLTVEPDETFQVVLSAAEGASLGTATATATILNDDTAFSIVGANSIQKEGNSGTTPFSFTVQREGSTVGAASVDWTVSASGGDPASASDFVGGTFPKGTVAFADGEDSKTITIDVLADSEVEADESFTVSLTNPVGGSINTASAVGTILNDDTTLSITALNADQPEGDSGTTAFTFTVSRAGDTSGTSSATWSVSGSGAHPADAADFGGSLPTGTVTFAPGVSTQTITIQVTGDTTVEPGEEFTVTLTDASGATLAQASATGTIQDDDLKAIELQLAGGVKLSFVLDSAPAEFGTEGLGVLQGHSSTVQSLYGLSDVSITVDSVANGVASISGSGQWAGKAVAFSGKLGASGNTYTLSDVSGSLDLGTWLGSSTHFRNHVNGQLSLNSTDPTTPQFVVGGVAEVWLDPDSATRAQPFTANLKDFTVDARGIAGFSITPSDLTAGFQLKLADADFTAGGQALTYARSSDLSGYTITLTGAGTLELPQADALEVSGDLVFAGAIGGGGTRPTTALLEIVNTTPVAIAGTTFTSTGGLKVVYQEDSSRSHGVFAVQGSNSIDLERMRGLQVQLGSSGFDLAAVLANLNLAPTLWTLGSIQDADGKQPFDLGLIRVEDLQLHLDKTQLLNRSVASGTSGSDPALTLAQALAGSGLFTVMPLAPSLQERFTIFGLDGTPLSEVVIDITAATTANASVSRSLALTEREKVALFTAYKRKEAEDSGDVEFETIADSFSSDDVLAEFQAFTDYIQSSTNKALTYGSVSINEQGEWTYTLDPSKVAGQLGATSFSVSPRLNIATELTAGVSDVEASIPALLAGMKSTASLALVFLGPYKPLVNTLEKEIRLTGNRGIDSVILSLLESVPDNAYRDGKLQLIELVDTAAYLKGSTDATITTYFKTLGNTIRTLELLAGRPSASGLAGMDSLELGLLFRSDLSAEFNDPYAWLYNATAGTPGTLNFSGDIASLAKQVEAAITLKAPPAKPDNKTVQGALQKSSTSNTDQTFSLNLPPLFNPADFIADYITGERLELFTMDVGFELELGGSLTIPTGIPLVDGILGVDLEAELAFSLISLLAAEELDVLGAKVNLVLDDKTLTESQKTDKISELVGQAFREGLGSDLSNNKLSFSLEPYIGLRLGIPNYNISGRLGIYFDYELGSERQIVDSNGSIKGAVDGIDQRIRFNDYYGEKPSGSYSYNPTLGSLRLDLDHNYDFLLARGSLDDTRFANFDEAYGRNSWLLNLQIEPLNLRNLIGSSSVSYDKTLLEKLGDQLIDRIDWISVAGSSLVTPRGVDLFFADAKFLNSPASNALRNALKRQHPSLSDQELGRLLSLVVDHGLPTRVSYALADAQALDERIDAMQSVVSVRSVSDLKSPVAPSDRFRLRYEENGKEAAVDSYLYYSLAQPKYIEINPKLTTNFASIEFDLISEGKNIELDLHYYDGSRWRLLGNVVDSLDGKPIVRLANGSVESIGFNYRETAQPDPDRYVHNSGTLSLQLALVHMERPGATADEQRLLELARSGELRLRLSDSGETDPQVTFAGAPRVERGGAIYTKAADAGAVLRQAPTSAWSSELASGAVQWLMPAAFQPLAERSDLAFLTSSDKATRSAGIAQNLNPHAPLAVQLAVHQMEGRSSSHLSASQSGTLASAVQGVMRFTHDPIADQAYKSYIGADGRVRIAARSFDGQDWLDIATLGGLQLQKGETHAPDLVAINGQLVVASWNSAGALVTYLIDPQAAPGSANALREVLPTSVSLDRQTSAASGDNQWGSAGSASPSNRDLQIGLEKRLDLSASSTSLQKAYYLSLLDPIQQVYATSSNALRLPIEGYGAVANSQSLLDAANTWASSVTPAQARTQAQLKALLGFGEKSSQGLFSTGQPGSALAGVRAASPSSNTPPPPSSRPTCGSGARGRCLWWWAMPMATPWCGTTTATPTPAPTPTAARRRPCSAPAASTTSPAWCPRGSRWSTSPPTKRIP
jgi:hypothetical protein